MADFERQAREAGLTKIRKVIEFGNPKSLLAVDIPDKENVDLIMVGATGLNTFERLLIGSSSEYILRHAKVDLLIVRDSEKRYSHLLTSTSGAFHIKRTEINNSVLLLFYFSDFADSDITSDSEVDWLSSTKSSLAD